MKKRLCSLVLVGLIGVGVAYSQESSASPSAQEALEKGKAADANKNYEEAKKWWRIAAMQGNAEAQCNLGNQLIGEAALLEFANAVTKDSSVQRLSESRHPRAWSMLHPAISLFKLARIITL
jgi:TPR repeat protein